MICTQSAPMKPVPDLCGNSRRRALAAAGLASCCLERGLILAALAGARAAARSTLLTLAAAPPRAAGPDIQLLRELASAPLPGLGLRPAAQEVRVRVALAAVDRLLGPVTGAVSALRPHHAIGEGGFPQAG